MQPTDNTPQPGVTTTDEYQKQLGAVMMHQAATKPKAAPPAPPEAKPTTPTADEFERIAEARAAEGHEHHRRPYRQPGPGMLLRLAHWLNLK